MKVRLVQIDFHRASAEGVNAGPATCGAECRVSDDGKRGCKPRKNPDDSRTERIMSNQCGGVFAASDGKVAGFPTQLCLGGRGLEE